MTEGASAKVPALWALFNGVLMGVAGALGAKPTILYLYGGAIAITELYAAAVFVSERAHPLGPRQYAVRGSTGAALWLALTCAFGALAGGYGLWFAPLAGATLIITAYVMVAGRRRR